MDNEKVYKILKQMRHSLMALETAIESHQHHERGYAVSENVVKTGAEEGWESVFNLPDELTLKDACGIELNELEEKQLEIKKE